MRINHMAAGLLAFGTGLFLSLLSGPQVVMFIRGAAQPVTLAMGFMALCGAAFGRKELKTLSAIASGLFLFIGAYGVYDEFYAFVDVMRGTLPLLLLSAGVISLCCGIRHRDGG